jgi:hypothetical protein
MSAFEFKFLESRMTENIKSPQIASCYLRKGSGLIYFLFAFLGVKTLLILKSTLLP